MDHPSDEGTTLRAFSRPRYFYGQLLDVRHFESEQDYFKRKVWMLNRMVSGYGVVCGLDVQPTQDGSAVVVAPGLALDKRGREIVVPCFTKRVPIEPQPQPEKERREHDEPCDDDWVHLVLCFDEHAVDPEPVLAGGCEGGQRCSPGGTREAFRLETRPGRAPEISLEPQISNLIKGGSLNYRAIVDWVSAPCDDEPRDACIVLANVRRPHYGGKLSPHDIEIWARPVVFSIDLLWELLLALTHESQPRRGGKN